MLVIHPYTTVSSRACLSFFSASALSVPWTMILASVGSYSAETTVPVLTHVSTLAQDGNLTSVSWPGEGMKSLTGFSAYSLASIDAPLHLIGWLKSGAMSAAM
ncbi:hypothetical protein OGATHE_000531 [Ogataea polymorpha]|uniref:Uncharacterized protein n=1 Tax=Ogataea polymorpha TaxID=460523 RepID=A0A9P8PUL3_9ASCO|nr:hypothetical protein OGATHE_000531 [Ogataea polymorpha]